MRGAATLYGLRVVWETQGLARDPVHRLLAAFEEASGSGPAAPSSRAPDVSIRIEAGEVGDDERWGDGAAPRPAFFQGNVRGFERGGEILILAPAARVKVASDGSSIGAKVDPATLSERGFADTTLVIALSLALRHHGLFHLHGGALVRGDGRRVVVLGDSGSGKTTVTLGLLDAGAQHLGDDTLFFGERDGRVRLFAFPRAFHLGPATARAFPALGARQADGETKVDVAIEALPGRPCPFMDAPDVVLFPQVTRGPRTQASELSKADAFGLAIPSCAFVAVDGLGQKAQQLQLLRALLERARAFELSLGADWLEAPERAAELVPWDT